MKLTVFYEDPFWVGVFERQDEAGYSVCRVVFGSEPTDAQVKELVLANYRRLEFSAALKQKEQAQTPRNAKRAQREARRELKQSGISSKAQEAMRIEIESRKVERAVVTKEMRQAEEQRRFQQKQEKRKRKHRGH